jgi:hypothetical protein
MILRSGFGLEPFGRKDKKGLEKMVSTTPLIFMGRLPGLDPLLCVKAKSKTPTVI